jgi:hypothetical protein
MYNNTYFPSLRNEQNACAIPCGQELCKRARHGAHIMRKKDAVLGGCQLQYMQVRQPGQINFG